MQEQCVVVGASAVGSAAAAYLAEKGVNATLLEEHDQPGKFHKCSGLFSKTGLEALGLRYKPSVLNSVRGARFYSGRQEVVVASSNTQAYVTNRQLFDELLCSQAVEKGAKLVLGARVDDAFQSNEGAVVKFADKQLSSKVLLACDGASSTIASKVGFPTIAPKDYALAWEAEYSGAKPSELDKVQVFLEPDLFPGFFGWTIPVSGDRIRIGLGTSNFPAARKAKVELLGFPIVKEQLCKAVMEREFFHTIPLRSRRVTQMGNILLAGDAAGQTKATTGGGVIFGCQCARIASECISEYLVKGTPINYESRWRARVGRTLGAHRFLRSLYDSLNPKTLAAFTLLAGWFGAPAIVSRFGHMDNLVT